MKSLKQTPFYRQAIHELEYEFGTFYLFDGFVIGEINAEITFTWENHGKKVAYDLSELYDSNGKDIIYISNRINDYSIIPTDWMKFFKYGKFKLKGYIVVSYTRIGYNNSLLEKLFFNTKLVRFSSIEEAINWAQTAKNYTKISNSKENRI